MKKVLCMLLAGISLSALKGMKEGYAKAEKEFAEQLNNLKNAADKNNYGKALLNEYVRNFFIIKNECGSFSLFKESTEQQNSLFDGFKKIKTIIHFLADGTLDEHSLKIQLALNEYFTTMDNIRIYLKKNIKDRSYAWLNDYEAKDQRMALKDQFEKLDKKVIDGYLTQLAAVQKQMNAKFGLFSKSFKSEAYKMCYDQLKKLVQTVNDLIKGLTSGSFNCPELFDLMKKKSGSSFSLFGKKPAKQTTGTLIENGKLVEF